MNEIQAMSRLVEISTIGGMAVRQEVEASADERAELAAALGLVEILALSADIELRRGQKGAIHLDGRLDAKIVQNCIVSLEPVTQTVSEPIRLRMIEAAGRARPTMSRSDAGEVDIDPALEDPPDVIEGPAIDLGVLVVEHLILAIDPYPRAPGAVLPDNPAKETGDSKDSPFAELAEALRADPGKR